MHAMTTIRLSASASASASTSSAPLPRYHFLDWVRILAFFLLILYHVGMYYVTWGWHVKSPHASDALDAIDRDRGGKRNPAGLRIAHGMKNRAGMGGAAEEVGQDQHDERRRSQRFADRQARLRLAARLSAGGAVRERRRAAHQKRGRNHE